MNPSYPKPLGDTETKRLLKRLANNKQLSVSSAQINELAEHVSGYPPAAYFVVQQAKDYGIELLLREKTSLSRFTSDIFLRHLSKIGLSRDEKRVIRLLASYSPLPIRTITEVLEIDQNNLDKILIRMIDLALIIATDCGHYRISDPISNAALRAFGYLSNPEQARVAKYLSSYLDSTEFQGPRLQLSQIVFAASRLSGDLNLASQAIHLADDLIKLTETLYNNRRYAETVETAYVALKERPKSLTARRYLIRGLIQEEKWEEAKNQIEELRKYAPQREILYHQGFLERRYGDIPKAINNYKNAKDLGWTGSAINRELAYCHYRLREYDSAAKYIKEALQGLGRNRFIVDLSAQIAIRRRDKQTALQSLETLRVIDEPIYYYHRLSTFERTFGTTEAALDAAQRAVNEDKDSPPFGVLAQLADCQIESGHYKEARESIKILNKIYSGIKNDIRQCLLCKLEIACKNFGEALRITQYITNKNIFVYKKLRHDALKGELATSALSDKTRIEYKSEFAHLDEELQTIMIEEIVSGLFDIELE